MDHHDQIFLAMEGVEFDGDWTLRNVAVLGPRSVNKRKYPVTVRRRAAKLYEGAQVFANHDWERAKKKQPRLVQDFVGTLHGVSVKEGILRASELRLVPDDPLAKKVRDAVRANPAALGLSHEAKVRYKSKRDKDGDLVVESIDSVARVAVVTEAATTSTMFESAADEDTAMDWKELTMEGLRENRSDLVDELTAEIKASVSEEVNADARVKELEKQVEEAKVTAEAKAKETSDEKDAKIISLETHVANRDALEAVLVESKIDPKLVTPAFRKTLLACEGKDQMIEACVDRIAVAGHAKIPVRSDDGTEGTEGDAKIDRKAVLEAVRG